MDVTVFGLVMGTHLIEDISIDVPHGTSVIIPADKANRSKDLWRAINQKLLFRIDARPQPVPVQPDISAARATEIELRKRITQLEAENILLRSQLLEQASRKMPELDHMKLDSILTLLRQGVPAQGIQMGSKLEAGEFDAAPTFIPANITPENIESRIEAKRGQSEGASVTGAADKLRQLRQKPKP